MHDLIRAVTAHAERNLGVVDRDAALALGVTEDDWHHLSVRGLLVPVDLQVARIAGHPTSWRQSIHAAALASHGLASRRSAARLHGVYRTSALDVLVPRNRRYRNGLATAHRSLDLVPSDITMVGPTPTTTVVRTLVDLGAVISAASLDVVVRRALHEEKCTLEDLTTRFLQVARKGRTGVGRLRRVLQEIDPAMAPTQSALETLTLRALRDNGIPPPVTQHEVWVDGRQFFLDIAWPKPMVFLEVDGAVHAGPRQFEQDRIRQNLLVKAGWTPLRFTGTYIRSYPAEMCLIVKRTLPPSCGA